MDFPELTIEREIRDGQPKQAGRKTRRFSVTRLGWMEADSAWDAGSTRDVTRPVWLAYVGTEAANRAFTANLRAGRKATSDGEHFQIPRKAPHRWVHQRAGDGLVTVAYVPDLFHLDVTSPKAHIEFLFAPPTWWIEEQAETLRSDFGPDAEDAARAALFAAFLDRRSPLPLLNDLGFQLRLYRQALEQEWLAEARPTSSTAHGRPALAAYDTDRCGLDTPRRIRLTQAELAAFLTALTHEHFEEEIRHGSPRIPSTGRLLPYPDLAGVQLCLDLGVSGMP